jgi:CheY-like chemotaxis protein
LRISCAGPFVMLDARSAVQLALVVHELATNARKYGALSLPDGQLAISWSLKTNGARELFLEWKETGVPNVSAPTSHGFGSTLIQRTLEANGGEVSTRYEVGGITCAIRLPLAEADSILYEPAIARPIKERDVVATRNFRLPLQGKRILLVEDEPLVGMEIGSDLAAAGCEIVGPAGSLKIARRLIDEGEFDAALVDANLAGEPVDEIAAALAQKAIPFAFATGYGRKALPTAFRDNLVLTKPFNRDQLLAVVERLLEQTDSSSPNVVPLRRNQP